MPFVIIAMYKWYNLDPVEEGLIMNEQELIIKSYLPEFNSQSTASREQAILYFLSKNAMTSPQATEANMLGQTFVSEDPRESP